MTTPVNIHLVGKRRPMERRSAGLFHEILAFWPALLIGTGLTVSIGGPIYDKAGTPDVTIQGQVTAKDDTPASRDVIPVVDGKGMTHLTVRYRSEIFEVRVHGDDARGGYGKKMQVSEATFHRLSVGSPAEITYYEHRIGHGIEIEQVTFPRTPAKNSPRRAKP